MSEHEDLTQLLTNPGWLRVGEYARLTWTEQLSHYLTQAAGETEDVAALNKLRQVLAAKRAVEQLLAWPAERLRQLETRVAGDRALPSLSRRGGL